MRRITSPSQLPEFHFCHDSTPVLISQEGTGESDDFETRTLVTARVVFDDGTLRSPLIYRRIDGYLWKTADGETLIVSCEIVGKLTPRKRTYLHGDSSIDDIERDQHFIASPESGDQAFAELHVWLRPTGGKWSRRSAMTIRHSDNGENPPWAFARFQLLETPVPDPDIPERGAVFVSPCRKTYKQCQSLSKMEGNFYVGFGRVEPDRGYSRRSMTIDCDMKEHLPKPLTEAEIPLVEVAREIVQKACRGKKVFSQTK